MAIIHKCFSFTGIHIDNKKQKLYKWDITSPSYVPTHKPIVYGKFDTFPVQATLITARYIDSKGIILGDARCYIKRQHNGDFSVYAIKPEFSGKIQLDLTIDML